MDANDPDRHEETEHLMEEAAQIDARDPDAPEEIAELMEEADQMGLSRPAADGTEPPTPSPRRDSPSSS